MLPIIHLFVGAGRKEREFVTCDIILCDVIPKIHLCVQQEDRRKGFVTYEMI